VGFDQDPALVTRPNLELQVVAPPVGAGRVVRGAKDRSFRTTRLLFAESVKFNEQLRLLWPGIKRSGGSEPYGESDRTMPNAGVSSIFVASQQVEVVAAGPVMPDQVLI